MSDLIGPEKSRLVDFVTPEVSIRSLLEEISAINYNLAKDVDHWLSTNGVTIHNAHEFSLEFDTIKQIYYLRRNGETVSFLEIYHKGLE